jgi:uncharacterized protein (DUF1778 family)
MAINVQIKKFGEEAMTVVAPKDVRLVARVPEHVQEFVKIAAEISGATLSQFIVEAVTVKARKVIDSQQNIQLTMKGAETFFAALDNPPPINEKLKSVAESFDKKGGYSYVKDSTPR